MTHFSGALKAVGIEYFHIPELGISSEKRDEASIYESDSTLALFESYEKELPSKQKHIEDLLAIYEEQKCISITCFEKEPCNCHRSRLARFLKIDFKNL